MFLIRKIGKLLRGAATPFQVFLAAILGALLGFVPSFSRSPALVVGLVLLLVVFNANLVVAGLVGTLAKLASLALMPVSFAAGRMLLDGPARPLFAKLVNAPVTAFFGLEYYVCTGGLLLAVVFGLVAGWLFTLPVKAFRRTMGKVEDKSGFYERHQGNPLVRLLLFVLFGRRHKWDSYRELLNRRVGNPIRIPGVVLAALVVGGVWFGATRWLATPLLTKSLKDGLESLNGATVDVGALELDLKNDRLSIHDLELCDSHALDRDLFAAKLVECEVAGADLLRKRVKLDHVKVSEAHSGTRRAKPGELVAKPSEPSAAPSTNDPNSKTLDEWLASAKQWKERLGQAKEWIDKLSKKKETKPGEAPKDETLRERLEREVEAKGWRNVAATDLVEGAPAFQIGEVVVDGMSSDALGRKLDLVIQNLSTDPSLVDGAPRMKLATKDDFLKLDANLASAARVPGKSVVDLKLAGVAADSLGLKQLRSGLVDAGFQLGWSADSTPSFDTPLVVKLRDAELALGSAPPTKVAELAIPLSLHGPLDNPRVTLDAQKLGENLLAAGKAELANALQAEAQKRIGAVEAQAQKKVDDAAEKAKQEADERAKKALEKGLGDLNPFGKKKKKDEKKDGGR
jgi:uncharacterized protein (TIGR03546 family)